MRKPSRVVAEISWAWAIETRTNPSGYMGFLRFDHMERSRPWRVGMPTALFATRREARTHLPKVKGPSERGLYPYAQVVRVKIRIEPGTTPQRGDEG